MVFRDSGYYRSPEKTKILGHPVCGIAALIRYPEGHLSSNMIREMSDIISHRGPDDEGFLFIPTQMKEPVPYGGKDTPESIYKSRTPYSPLINNEQFERERARPEPCIFLGHRRLSIVDLSPMGHQPMCLPGSSIWITYNGEIYNYLEIRLELESFGHRFTSHTDTEVILAAYTHWGIKCLDKFNGMFAFVLVDLKQRRLFAARDRFGVKPLYYWRSSKGFLAFASEIKQFIILPGWHAQINRSRAADYLTSGITDVSRETMFSDVFQLQGGEYIECKLPLTEPPIARRWYRLVKNSITPSFEEAKQTFYALFEDSVRLRLRADVGIGSCLSGGIDSSSIVCMVHHLLKNRSIKGIQKTFSAGSHIPKYDERHFMDEIINHTDVDAHFVTPSLTSLLRALKQIVWHQDEPFGSSSIFAQHQVFDLAKKAGVKVMLDGQGADEILLGYTDFWLARFAQLIKQGRWSDFHQERQSALRTHSLNSISKKALIKQLLPVNIKHVLKQMRLTSPFSRLCFPWINLNDFTYKPYPHYNENISDLVDQLSYHQLLSTHLPSLLRYEDRNSMTHSIEARTPFLDYRLVEFVFNLPTNYKMSRGYSKRILRESIGMLPDKIRWRTDKIGFATAEETWMCKEAPDLFRKEVSEAILKSKGLINSKANILADQMISGRIPFDWSLWRIINFGYWVEMFL